MTFIGMLMYNSENEEIAKPSEVLSGVRAMMDVLQTLENYIHVDVSRIFNNVLLQQTQPADGFNGEHTITYVSGHYLLLTKLPTTLHCPPPYPLHFTVHTAHTTHYTQHTLHTTLPTPLTLHIAHYTLRYTPYTLLHTKHALCHKPRYTHARTHTHTHTFLRTTVATTCYTHPVTKAITHHYICE